jgi:hypothetical protein
MNSEIQGSSHIGSGIDLEKGRLGDELNPNSKVNIGGAGSKISVLGDGSTATKEDVKLWKSLLDKPATTYVGKYVQKVLEIRLEEYKHAQKQVTRPISAGASQGRE